jgi:hypothetical protein
MVDAQTATTSVAALPQHVTRSAPFSSIIEPRSKRRGVNVCGKIERTELVVGEEEVTIRGCGKERAELEEEDKHTMRGSPTGTISSRCIPAIREEDDGAIRGSSEERTELKEDAIRGYGKERTEHTEEVAGAIRVRPSGSPLVASQLYKDPKVT